MSDEEKKDKQEMKKGNTVEPALGGVTNDGTVETRMPNCDFDFSQWRKMSHGIKQPEDSIITEEERKRLDRDALITIVESHAQSRPKYLDVFSLLTPGEKKGTFVISDLEFSLSKTPLDVRAEGNRYLSVQNVKLPDKLAVMYIEAQKLVESVLVQKGLQKASELCQYFEKGYVSAPDGTGLEEEAEISKLIFDEVVATDSGSKKDEERFMMILIYQQDKSRAVCQLIRREDDVLDDKVLRVDVFYYPAGSAGVKHIPVLENK